MAFKIRLNLFDGEGYPHTSHCVNYYASTMDAITVPISLALMFIFCVVSQVVLHRQNLRWCHTCQLVTHGYQSSQCSACINHEPI